MKKTHTQTHAKSKHNNKNYEKKRKKYSRKKKIEQCIKHKPTKTEHKQSKKEKDKWHILNTHTQYIQNPLPTA